MKLRSVFLFLAVTCLVGTAHATGCNTELDCHFPGTCDQGLCKDECHFDSDCDANQICDYTRGNTCINGPAPGWEECHSSFDCKFPMSCNNGLCVGH